MLESMFEGVGAGGLLDAMRDAQRAERRDTARRLLAMGRFTQQRLADAGDEHGNWCVDDWEAIAAEVAAQLGWSRHRASSQMNQGVTLLERLPRLAEVFAAGDVDPWIITVSVYRTGLLVDPDALAAVDALLAEQAPYWNARSRERVAELIDWIVVQHDPDAVRQATQAEVDRHIGFAPDINGMTDIYGSLRATAAAALNARLNAMAATVCRTDPRTTTQRRADALEYLADGGLTLPCLCDTHPCPATETTSASPASGAHTVIHVLPDPPDHAAEAAEQAGATTTAATGGRRVVHLYATQSTLDGTGTTPALLAGYGALPAAALRDLATRAAVRHLNLPHHFGVEDHYRPSAALADCIRARDLTCRFPGCHHPAESCDIDHTIPWPAGPTHPANLKLLCRTHHLLKTFYTGPTGWHDQQLPDGTVLWTAPTGRTHTTTPAGALYFPHLAHPSSDLPPPEHPTTDTALSRERGLAMPTRRRTRADDRAYRITWERNRNHAHHDANPPPF